MAQDHQRAVAADGVRLAVSIVGEGSASPVLLIPGLGAAGSVFDPLAPLLAERYRVITFDPRGIGDSDAGRAVLTMALLASDAVAVLDSTGVQSATVLGASMGGVVAQHLVVRHPERVEHLLLAATAPGGQKTVPADPRATDALLGKGARTPEDAYRIACTVLYSAQFQRAHPDFIDAQVRQRAAHPVRPRVFTAQLAAMAAADDVVEHLRDVRAPTLVMHGTADAVTPMENAKLLAARMPGARTRWFDGCGHLFFHERPAETARVIHEFLRDAEAPS